MINFQPANLSRLSPCVDVDDVEKSIDFYVRAFGFALIEKHERNGVVSGAALKFGEVSFMIFDKSKSAYAAALKLEKPKSKAGSSIYAYCPNVDEFYTNALTYGAESLAEPKDSFWGDRFCLLLDIDGYEWGFATYQPDR